jgi:hypothetical protein
MGLPEMEHKPMTRGAKFCKCDPRCSHYIEIDYIGRLCETQAMDFAIKVINLAKGTNLSKGTYTNGWTTKQETYLKEWVENKGVKYGDYSAIGAIIGKTGNQVRRKVQRLEQVGRIVRRNIS